MKPHKAEPNPTSVKGYFGRFPMGNDADFTAMLLIAWTTVATRDEAEKLALDIVDARLAVCAQIDGPITSFYIWGGRVEQASEYRLTFKFLPDQSAELEKRVHAHHPYETPEWVTAMAENVSEKYLSWARASRTNPPL